MEEQLKVLIVHNGDSSSDPRIVRSFELLKSHNITCYSLINNNYSTKFIKKDPLPNSIFKAYRYKYNISKHKNLDFNIEYDIILLFDLYDVKILNKFKYKKCVIDLREYYLDQNSSLLHFIYFRRIFKNILNELIEKNDSKIIYTTVSTGLSELYQRLLNVKPIIIYSVPVLLNESSNLNALTENDESHKRISLVYHGVFNRNRGLLRLILLSVFIRKHDFHYVFSNYNSLKSKFVRLIFKHFSNIYFPKPYPYEEIIKNISAFDAGLLLYPKNNKNLDICMPNKVFDFMFAGLPILITPLNDLSKFIDRYKVGFKTKDFSLLSLWRLLASINLDKIIEYRNNTYSVVSNINYDTESEKLIKIYYE